MILSYLEFDILNISSCVTMDAQCQLLNSMYEQYQQICRDFDASVLRIQNSYLYSLFSTSN